MTTLRAMAGRKGKKSEDAPKKDVMNASGNRRGVEKTTRGELREAFSGLCAAYGRREAAHERDAGAWLLMRSPFDGRWYVGQIGRDGGLSLPFGQASHTAGTMLVVLEQLTRAAECAPRRGTGAA